MEIKNNKRIDEKELKELKELDDGWFPDWCLAHRATKLWEEKGLSKEEALTKATHSIEELGLIEPEVFEVVNWCRHLAMSEYVDDTMEKTHSKSSLMKNETFLRCLELLKQNIKES